MIPAKFSPTVSRLPTADRCRPVARKVDQVRECRYLYAVVFSTIHETTYKDFVSKFNIDTQISVLLVVKCMSLKGNRLKSKIDRISNASFLLDS